MILPIIFLPPYSWTTDQQKDSNWLHHKFTLLFSLNSSGFCFRYIWSSVLIQLQWWTILQVLRNKVQQTIALSQVSLKSADPAKCKGVQTQTLATTCFTRGSWMGRLYLEIIYCPSKLTLSIKSRKSLART